LTQRFVDQRTVVLMEQLSSGENLEAVWQADGTLTAAGVCLGQLIGFEFHADPNAKGTALKLIRRAARQVLVQPIAERVEDALTADHSALSLASDGWLSHGDGRIARVESGVSLWEPVVKPPRHDLLTAQQRAALQGRARQWVQTECTGVLACLEPRPSMTAPARALLYKLREGMGSLPRRQVLDELGALQPIDRKQLHRMGVRLGFHAVYSLPLLKPDMLRRRAWLWSLAHGKGASFPAPSGAPSVSIDSPRPFYVAMGYRCLGTRAVRLDMVERLDAVLRSSTRGGAAPLPQAAMSWLGCTPEELQHICQALGYRVRCVDGACSVLRPRSRARRSRR
jgi:ATP-dependent RNA helicase SUPV3L1/SUV3